MFHALWLLSDESELRVLFLEAIQASHISMQLLVTILDDPVFRKLTRGMRKLDGGCSYRGQPINTNEVFGRFFDVLTAITSDNPTASERAADEELEKEERNGESNDRRSLHGKQHRADHLMISHFVLSSYLTISNNFVLITFI